MGSRFQHGSFYLLIRLGGKPLAYVLLAFVVLWYVCYPSTRRKCSHYLRHRFPRRQEFWTRFLDSYRLVFNLGKLLIDRAALGILGPAAMRVEFPDGPRLLEILAAGKGLVMVGSHVGCWQTALAAFEHVPTGVNLVIHRAEDDVDLHYFEHRGQAPPFRIIDPRKEFLGGVLSMLEVLRRGEILGLMGDRVFGGDRHRLAVEFLGGQALFPLSPYVLASSAGSPIVVLFSHRTGRDSYRLELAKVIHVPEGIGRDPEALRPYVREFAQTLEGYVDRHPWQFMNFFDMWDTAPLNDPPPQGNSGPA
ncbi:MAG: lysophospholipid acyltransferase family protein [Lentisphaeria bacterium]|nr:lysophospholipid acyltransferase family protein [Lentisphaeria bacterium]